MLIRYLAKRCQLTELLKFIVHIDRFCKLSDRKGKYFHTLTPSATNFWTRASHVRVRACILRRDKVGLTCRHPRQRCLLQMWFCCMFLLRLIFFGTKMVETLFFSHLAVMMRVLNYFFLFFPWHDFLWQKVKIGFHLTESNGFFSFSLSWWCEYTTDCAN